MPMDKYKSFYEIVKMLIKFDLTKLRAIEKEFKVLSKIQSSGKKILGPKMPISRHDLGTNRKTQKRRRKTKKPSSAQLRARRQFAMRVRRGDFR